MFPRISVSEGLICLQALHNIWLLPTSRLRLTSACVRLQTEHSARLTTVMMSSSASVFSSGSIIRRTPTPTIHSSFRMCKLCARSVFSSAIDIAGFTSRVNSSALYLSLILMYKVVCIICASRKYPATTTSANQSRLWQLRLQ